MSLVLVETKDHVGVITLNNPAKRNALSHALIDDMITALAALKAQSARCIILRALAGSKVFSAGHDIGELPRGSRDPLTYSDPLRRGIRAIQTFPAPIIAMVEGSVWVGVGRRI